MKKPTTAANIKRALLKKDKDKKVSRKKYLSFGITPLNCACTGDPFIGLKPGHGYLFVGKSSSGKTSIMNTILAQACINPLYKKYKLINDDSESGNLFDLEAIYSPEVAKRIEPPDWEEGQPVFSRTVEDMFMYVRKAMKKGPVIYIEDSMDALMAADERDLHEENMQKREEGKESKASYGVEKAKANYRGFRYMLSDMKKSGSIVIIVCHSKELIGALQFQKKDTRSGGAALTYFATFEIWSKVIETLVATYKGKKIKTGIKVQLDVIKNRSTGKQRSVELPIYYSTGIDDLGCCIDFLVEYDHWNKAKGGNITAKEFDFQGSQEEIIQHIGKKPSRRRRLRRLVGKVWNKVESAIEVKRPNEYV